MGQLLRLPLDETVFARLTQRERDANTAAERSECVRLAHRLFKLPRLYKEGDLLAAWEILAAWEDTGKVLGLAERIIDKPAHIPDAVLRTVCDFRMKRGGGGVHYLRADQHIYAINMREIQARNRQKILIPREPDDIRWRDVIAGGVAVVAFGWAVLTLVLA